MKQSKMIRLACLLMALLSLWSGRMAEATSHRAMQCGGWSVVPSPNPYDYFDTLYRVAPISATDVWAVGAGYTNGGPLQAITVHWNGVRWYVVPNSSPPESELGGLVALSSSNVWATGSTNSSTLIEHWDGTQWSIVPSPSVGNYINNLVSVSAVSPSDIWAVGVSELGSGQPIRTLTEHWDGKQWSMVKSPNVGSYDSYLEGVTALSSTNVWAVGSYDSRQRPLVVRPLVEHWDGQQWRLVHAPGRTASGFGGVTAVSANDLWAVGSYAGTLTEHWNGHWNGQRWQVVKSPNPSQGPGIFNAVSAATSADVWAVGSYLDGSYLKQTLTEHWDGTQWQIVPSPNVQDAARQLILNNYLNGVAVVPSMHAFWAVGYYAPFDGYTGQTLIEYYC